MTGRLLGLCCGAVCLALAACGGGSTPTGAVREQKDPRTVPSATVPAVVPTFAAVAVDVAQAPGRAASLPDTYTVQPGDSPAGIAQQLGVDLNELLRLNNITDPTSLKVGQVLKVPRPSPTPTPTRPAATGTARPGATSVAGARTGTPSATAAAASYTVQPGDTGCGIAIKLGVSLLSLSQANNTTPQGLAALSVGQVLRVPSTKGDPGC